MVKNFYSKSSYRCESHQELLCKNQGLNSSLEWIKKIPACVPVFLLYKLIIEYFDFETI